MSTPREHPPPGTGLGPARHGFLRELRLNRDSVPGFDRYPFDIPAIRDLEVLAFAPGATVLVGENGSGKSTLIEAIAILAGLNAEGGTRNFRHSDHATESKLHTHLRLVRSIRRESNSFFLRGETMFNVSTEVLRSGLQAYGWRDLHAMSHGEAFLWLVQHRFRPNGLFVLDEPESALSPQRQLALLALLHDLVRNGSQIVMATHSPILMACPGALVYELGPGGPEPANYRDTEHYLVMRSFLEHPDRTLRELTGEPPE